MALEQMGLLAGECIFIDDLEINCKGAEAVGIRSIWVVNPLTLKILFTLIF